MSKKESFSKFNSPLFYYHVTKSFKFKIAIIGAFNLIKLF